MRVNKKSSLYLIAIVLLTAVFAGIFYKVLTVTPQYSNLKEKTLQGYSYKTFDGWKQQSIDTGSVFTMQYNDYIFDDNNGMQNKDIYAQHIVTVEQKAIPTSALTLATKAQLKTELGKTDGKLFDSLKQSIEGCAMLQDPSISISDTPTKNSFLAASFSFYCKQPNDKVRIRAVGKVVFADDGSAVTAIILAADTVFNKNETVFRYALDSVQKL